ncbi:altronate dehydratase small subunit [Salirhabdus euzebyi]|uniref:Altronate dehydratase small subunit n=1 Tax=Salirhabdus euzebyi TaxID=394506 RepID=A0A841Q5P4_9BACI|nr:UxaA family hydrolase [Salirhabdus euzebyi]MBB6453677.1 altronate dehydratase small subunit [Salirhabdus euzebyi]
MAREVHVIDPKDNTGTVISRTMTAGREVEVEAGGEVKMVKVLKDIPYGHKIAVRSIKKGDTIWKYGLSIGTALEDIEVGDHVHIHNIESNRGRGDLFKEKANAGESV